MPTASTTVVMATRDRRDTVLATMQRLHALPERPPVVLVDNGSSDGTADAVAAAFPDVDVVRLQTNRGAPARTVGVERAATPCVAFADDDSWWAPGALSEAAALFDAHPRMGLLAARILVGPQERLDPVCAQMADSPLGREPDLPGPSVLGFVACGAVVRREAYLQVGGFSPVVFFLGEETVLAQDLEAAGWGLAYVASVVAHHHPGLVAARPGRRRLQTRNTLLSVWLRRPARVVLRETAGLVRASGDADARGALLDATRRLPAVVADRRRLPDDVEQRVRLLERSG